MPSYLSIYKSFLRQKLRQKIGEIPPSSKKNKSRRIARRLLGAPDFARAKNILIYISRSDEVDTSWVIRQALKLKKGVFALKIDSTRRKMAAIKILNPDHDLIPGAYGIREPKTGHARKAYKIDLMIVPGLGFDRSGRRIGKGLGYFDRFLKGTQAKKIGIAFQEQLLSRVPVEKHDVSLDLILTDGDKE